MLTIPCTIYHQCKDCSNTSTEYGFKSLFEFPYNTSNERPLAENISGYGSLWIQPVSHLSRYCQRESVAAVSHIKRSRASLEALSNETSWQLTTICNSLPDYELLIKGNVYHLMDICSVYYSIKHEQFGRLNKLSTNRKWQDYVYIQCEYKSTKQKIKHLLREENKVKENKIS